MRQSPAIALAATLLLSACNVIGTQPQFPDEEVANAQYDAKVAKAPHPNLVGTPEWYAWVNMMAGWTEAEAPPAGSDAWNHAVHKAVMGFDPDESISFDRRWQGQVDRALRQNRGIFSIL